MYKRQVKDQAKVEEIYGGGLVEGDGSSSVEKATVVIEGGTVGSIYAGGYVVENGSGTTSVKEADVIIRGGTITEGVYASGFREGDTGTAKVETATITLDVDNAAVKTDGGNADTSILHLTDKVKTYDGTKMCIRDSSMFA